MHTLSDTRDTHLVLGVYTLETHQFRGLYREIKYFSEARLIAHTFENGTHEIHTCFRGLYTRDTLQIQYAIQAYLIAHTFQEKTTHQIHTLF